MTGDMDVRHARDAQDLAAAIALVSGGTSRWVMVCGVLDAETAMQDAATSARLARVDLRRTAPDTIMVVASSAPANLGHHATDSRGRGLAHAVLAVAGRLIGE